MPSFVVPIADKPLVPRPVEWMDMKDGSMDMGMHNGMSMDKTEMSGQKDKPIDHMLTVD